MNPKTFQYINEEYDLEISKVVKTIKNLKKQKAKKTIKVLLQFPDGLKPYATSISDEIKKELSKNKMKNTEILIWLDSCFGACDVPVNESKQLGIDLIIQFGHSAWNFEKKEKIKN